MPVHVPIKSKDWCQELSSIVLSTYSIRQSLSIKPWTCFCSVFLWGVLGITVVLKLAHDAPNHWAPCQVPHSVSKHGEEGVERAHAKLKLYQLKSPVLAELLWSFSHCTGVVEDRRVEKFSICHFGDLGDQHCLKILFILWQHPTCVQYPTMCNSPSFPRQPLILLALFSYDPALTFDR